MPPRFRRLALATGLTYHVLDWGDPAAETVVLVHGFLDVAWAWSAVAERLASRYHVLAPDLRGHGDTDWIGGGGYYHFLDYLADLDELIGREPRPVGLIGHSMGGSISGYYAGTRPDRVRRLALLEGMGPPEQQIPAPDRTARWMDAWRAARRADAIVLPSLEAAAARIRRHDPLIGETLALALATHGTRPVAGGVVWKHDPLHMTMGPYPFRVEVAEEYWRRVTCPTLVVDGEASTLRLPDAEAARRRAALANHRHVMLPGAGHAMQRHHPESLADLLLEFLAT